MMNNTFLSNYRSMLEGVLSDTQYKNLCESVNGSWFAIEYLSEDRSIQEMTESQIKSKMYELLEIIQKRNMVAVNYPYTYAKNIDDPSLIKIYDPMKCGSSCSTSAPDPWWIFTKVKPEEKELTEIFPRKGKKLFGFI